MRTFIAGHRGLVGSAIHRLIPNAIVRRRDELDLRWGDHVWRFFDRERPEHVYLAAAEVGGIQHNIDKCGDMIRSNLEIQTVVIDACSHFEVKRLCFLGSSCIYPVNAVQPMTEVALMTGPLEPTNSAYAIAKIAGVEMCRAYQRQHGLSSVCLMPTNLYGPNGFAGSQATHVIPMLIKRIHDAKVKGLPGVAIWGTGSALREFMHVDDLARAAVHFMNMSLPPFLVNIGTGSEISIAGLAAILTEIIGFDGDVSFDDTRPDGMPRKVLDVSLAAANGWRASIPLVAGLTETYRWYLDWISKGATP